MEMPEFDKKIKEALLSKSSEVIPSDETFARILKGLEKKQKRKVLSMGYPQCLIAFICAVSLLFGATIILSVKSKVSAREIINTVTTVIVLDKTKKLDERYNDEGIKPIVGDDTKPDNAGTLTRTGRKFILQTFTGCFLLSQLNNLELYLKLMIIGKMTLAPRWYEHKFWPGPVPA